jgi:hypothetical protein
MVSLITCLDPIATKLNDDWNLCKVASIIIIYTLVITALKLERVGMEDLGLSQTCCNISTKWIIVVITNNNF